jgi:hypothetical protein
MILKGISHSRGQTARTCLTLGWWETPTRSLWPAKTPPVAIVSSTCTFQLAAALRLIVMISKRCSQSWRVKSRLLSEEGRPSFELAKPSTFQRTRLTNSKTRAGNRRDCYACARRPGKKKEVGVPVATRTTQPPPLDEEAEAAFIAKVKALAPKYRTELLPPQAGTLG